MDQDTVTIHPPLPPGTAHENEKAEPSPPCGEGDGDNEEAFYEALLEGIKSLPLSPEFFSSDAAVAAVAQAVAAVSAAAAEAPLNDSEYQDDDGGVDNQETEQGEGDQVVVENQGMIQVEDSPEDIGRIQAWAGVGYPLTNLVNNVGQFIHQVMSMTLPAPGKYEILSQPTTESLLLMKSSEEPGDVAWTECFCHQAKFQDGGTLDFYSRGVIPPGKYWTEDASPGGEEPMDGAAMVEDTVSFNGRMTTIVNICPGENCTKLMRMNKHDEPEGCGHQDYIRTLSFKKTEWGSYEPLMALNNLHFPLTDLLALKKLDDYIGNSEEKYLKLLKLLSAGKEKCDLPSACRHVFSNTLTTADFKFQNLNGGGSRGPKTSFFQFQNLLAVTLAAISLCLQDGHSHKVGDLITAIQNTLKTPSPQELARKKEAKMLLKKGRKNNHAHASESEPTPEESENKDTLPKKRRESPN